MGLDSGSNAGAWLDSVEATIVREGDIGVGDEFAVSDNAVVEVREERESFRRGRRR